MKFLLIDNYDSFTFMLADYIRQCNIVCTVLRNDNPLILNEQFVAGFDALVLSPGPKTPLESGMLMQVIDKFHTQKPILGICLGHQAIGVYFGAKLSKAILPRHGKVDLIVQNTPSVLFKNLPEQFFVTRYHSLVLTHINLPLQVTAQTQQGECMAMQHNHLPIFGLQFHPESCQTQHGLSLIRNFWIFLQALHLPIK